MIGRTLFVTVPSVMLLDLFHPVCQSLAEPKQMRNKKVKQSNMVVNPQELIKIARDRWKTDREIRNNTGLSRTTIWRMESGGFSFHAETIGKLVKAINRG